jgi:hypothetical protein
MFDITSFGNGPAKGFHMTFDNGWTVSVQWGSGNYCENKYIPANVMTVPACADAEIAAWDANGEWFEFENDTVCGNCSANDVAAFMAKIMAF